MEILITESQISRILRETRVSLDRRSNNDDINNSFVNQGHYKWFNIDNIKDYYPPNIIEDALKKTLEMLYKMYGYQMKRVVVKDKGVIVGFLIWSDKGSKLDDLGDGNTYPVILSTALAPEYRGRGLLKRMIQRANLQKPYLVQTSAISPEGFWKKMGCDVVKKIDSNNQIEMCK